MPDLDVVLRVKLVWQAGTLSISLIFPCASAAAAAVAAAVDVMM